VRCSKKIWALVSILASACSVVLSPEDSEIKCSSDGLSDPCPTDKGLHCVEGICQSCQPVSAELLRLSENSQMQICLSACCSDADCEPDQVCVIGQRGVRSCVSQSFMRRSGISAIRRVGESCDSDRECGTNSCRNGSCFGYCFSDDDCQRSGNRCVFVPQLLSRFGGELSCGDARGELEIGQECTPNWLGQGECASGICIQSSQRGVDICTNPCGSNRHCPQGYFCGQSSSNGMAVCILSEDGVARSGEPCRTNADCIDAPCVNGLCLQMCCNDSDCQEGMLCLPVSDSGTNGMYCIQPG